MKWPPIPGDFEVGNPSGCVAVCTLGKKIHVDADYAIIGTCKTENIGIERVIVNVISNGSVRFLILAGPEVPGHLTGSSLRCLHEQGVDPDTRKIIGAPGAIPYIENIPVEAVERFRTQVEFVDMMNNSKPKDIASKVHELNGMNPGIFSEEAIWIDFAAASRPATTVGLRASISLLPEYGMSLDPTSSIVARNETRAIITVHPTFVGAETKDTDPGTINVGKELK
jgi:tetrahydromethanopterin S-methyltransferase subunit A